MPRCKLPNCPVAKDGRCLEGNKDGNCPNLIQDNEFPNDGLSESLDTKINDESGASSEHQDAGILEETERL